MRIKKFQKIICLGLALLSIMVLPCSATEFTIYGYENSDGLNPIIPDYQEGDYVFNILQQQGYLKNYVYNKSFIFTDTVEYYEIITTKKDLYLCIVGPQQNIYYLLNSWEGGTQLNPIKNININDPAPSNVKLYKLNTINLNGNYNSKFKFITATPDYNISFYGINVLLLTPVDEAVINITTYTNLLTQNFAKAFTFMTGPALPWVLLGISVSLISFGIYSAKRFL